MAWTSEVRGYHGNVENFHVCPCPSLISSTPSIQYKMWVKMRPVIGLQEFSCRLMYLLSASMAGDGVIVKEVINEE